MFIRSFFLLSLVSLSLSSKTGNPEEKQQRESLNQNTFPHHHSSFILEDKLRELEFNCLGIKDFLLLFLESPEEEKEALSLTLRREFYKNQQSESESRHSKEYKVLESPLISHFENEKERNSSFSFSKDLSEKKILFEYFPNETLPQTRDFFEFENFEGIHQKASSLRSPAGSSDKNSHERNSKNGSSSSFTIEEFLKRYPEVRRVSARYKSKSSVKPYEYNSLNESLSKLHQNNNNNNNNNIQLNPQNVPSSLFVFKENFENSVNIPSSNDKYDEREKAEKEIPYERTKENKKKTQRTFNYPENQRPQDIIFSHPQPLQPQQPQPQQLTLNQVFDKENQMFKVSSNNNENGKPFRVTLIDNSSHENFNDSSTTTTNSLFSNNNNNNNTYLIINKESENESSKALQNQESRRKNPFEGLSFKNGNTRGFKAQKSRKSLQISSPKIEIETKSNIPSTLSSREKEEEDVYYDELVPLHHRFNQESQTTENSQNKPAVLKKAKDKKTYSSLTTIQTPSLDSEISLLNPPPTSTSSLASDSLNENFLATGDSTNPLISGPYGYIHKGTFFSDEKLNEFPSSIDIGYQGFLWTLDVSYPISGKVSHGGVHDIIKDKVKRARILLKDDYIISVRGRSSPYNINRLTFTTQKGVTYGPYGDRRSEKSYDFNINAPDNHALFAISGTVDFGVPFRSISFHWKPLNNDYSFIKIPKESK